jgi:cutinase
MTSRDKTQRPTSTTAASLPGPDRRRLTGDRGAIALVVIIAAALLAGAVGTFVVLTHSDSPADQAASTPIESASPASNGSATDGPALDASASPTPSPSQAGPSPVGGVKSHPAAAGASQSSRPTQPSNCPDVALVFARGTGDNSGQANLGVLGEPLGNALRSDLPGLTVQATGVDYAAASDQSSAGPGATAMTHQIIDLNARCPATLFVVGGYSQGASVTDIALGVPGANFLGHGDTVPSALASRIVAVVVFGNPLSNFGGTIESASPTYGPKAKSYCGRSDNVCGGSRNGNVDGGHLDYGTNGSVTDAAAFAAAKVRAV